jgi:hypothetical protein
MQQSLSAENPLMSTRQKARIRTMSALAESRKVQNPISNFAVAGRGSLNSDNFGYENGDETAKHSSGETMNCMQYWKRRSGNWLVQERVFVYLFVLHSVAKIHQAVDRLIEPWGFSQQTWQGVPHPFK